jgi:outer-membrane receptor for ferric coprogen and ferric-rhodotorulic acid
MEMSGMVRVIEQRRNTRWGMRSAALLVAATAGTLALPRPAQAQAARHAVFAIAAQPLPDALTLFGQQSGMQVSVHGDLVRGRASPGVQGDLPPLEALSRLLVGTGLTFRVLPDRTLTLDPAPQADGAVHLGPVQVEGSTAPQDQATADTPVTDRAATDHTHSYAARAATVAGKTAQDLRDIPQSLTVVTRQRMDDQNMITLEQALRQTTGVTAIPYGDGSAYYQVRGYAAEVQYDGIPANSAVQYQTQFDLAMYDRIEVLRGPSGLLQGSGQPAGTINLVRKRPHDTFGWAGDLMGGSWDNFHGDIDVTGPLNAAGTIRGRLVASGEDRGYFTDQEHERHAMVYGVLEFDLAPNTTLTVSGSWENQKQAPLDYGQSTYTDGTLLNAPRSAFFGTSWSRSVTHTRDAYASIDHDLGNGWTAMASLDWRQQQLSGPYGYIDGPVNPDDSATYALQNQYVMNKWFGSDANISGPVTLLGRRHTLLFGVNYAWQDDVSYWGFEDVDVADVYHITLPETDVAFTGGSDTRTTQFGAYAQGRFSLADPLTLVAGVRVTDYRAEERDGVAGFGAFHATARTTGHVTPTAGLVYALTRQISLYGSYASIFVPQTNLVFGGGTLKPRTGEQFEIGAKGSFLGGALTASAALFDIIDRNRAYDDPAHPNYYIAAGKVRSRGAEAEVSGEPLPGWSLFAGYTYLETKFLDDSASQGLIYDSEEPRHTLKLWSTYRLGPIDARGFQIGGGLRAMSSTTRGGPVQAPYAVIDAQLGYRLNRQWSMTVSVNNLLDKTYYARVPNSYFGIYGEPRSVMVALRKGF